MATPKVARASPRSSPSLRAGRRRIDRRSAANLGTVRSQEAAAAQYPPQQARSRATLHKVLTAAEQVLASDGVDEFTVAAVADRAGVSVGAIYRRFAGREQLINSIKERLLGEVEDALGEQLRAARPGIAGVVEAFTRALVASFSAKARVIPEIAGARRDAESVERSTRVLSSIQQHFTEAAAPHADEVRRSDPGTALAVAGRTIAASCIHRALTAPLMPDDLPWSVWEEQLVDMALLYLTTPEHQARS